MGSKLPTSAIQAVKPMISHINSPDFILEVREFTLSGNLTTVLLVMPTHSLTLVLGAPQCPRCQLSKNSHIPVPIETHISQLITSFKMLRKPFFHLAIIKSQVFGQSLSSVLEE